ncbi:MAG: threonine/serine exporter family protein, partial [Clostridia bacterium]|nr:threonine/serine exporter family protein [Clostridia bacterium]
MDKQEVKKEFFADDLLRLALDVGEGMLKNGGEISRVEDTVERICRAYGAEHVEVFTIISVINASVRI